MSYARARLYLGIASVGFWVIASILALAADLPATLFPTNDADPNETARRLLIMIGLYILVGLPFDIVGGFILLRRFGLPAPGLFGFIGGWLRGVLAQGVVLFGAGMLYITAGKQSGSKFLVVVLAGIVMIGLLALQEWIARFVAGLRPAKADLAEVEAALKKWGHHLPDSFAVVQARDSAFSGAWAGLPGLDRLILPAAWVENLSAEHLAAQIVRRLGVLGRGSRERGIWLAALWNVAGFWIAVSLAGNDAVTTARGLMTSVLYFNLWSFAGALLLPSFSRPGVYEADRYAKQAGVPTPLLEEVIRELESMQGNEQQRPPIVEVFFYPVPSIENRVDRLALKQARPLGAWHGARMALYLSWACLGCLSRAAHSNVGRPELWVMLSAD